MKLRLLAIILIFASCRASKTFITPVKVSYNSQGVAIQKAGDKKEVTSETVLPDETIYILTKR